MWSNGQILRAAPKGIPGQARQGILGLLDVSRLGCCSYQTSYYVENKEHLGEGR